MSNKLKLENWKIFKRCLDEEGEKEDDLECWSAHAIHTALIHSAMTSCMLIVTVYFSDNMLLDEGGRRKWNANEMKGKNKEWWKK